MVQLGVKAAQAKKAVAGGRELWYNAGLLIHAAVPNRLLEEWGPLGRVQKHRQASRLTASVKYECIRPETEKDW